MLDLYTAGTNNGQRATITLEECRLPYTLHKVDLAKGGAKTEQFKKLNPNARIPVLVDSEGQVVARTRRFPDREALAHVRGGGELGWVPIPEETLAQERFVVLYPGREALLVRKNFVTGMNYFDEHFGEYGADADMALKIRKSGRRVEMYPGIRATWHASTGAAPNDAIHKSDRILGAATLLGNHYGFFAGLGFRVSAMLSALTRFDFSLLSALASGNKIGSQAQ